MREEILQRGAARVDRLAVPAAIGVDLAEREILRERRRALGGGDVPIRKTKRRSDVRLRSARTAETIDRPSREGDLAKDVAVEPVSAMESEIVPEIRWPVFVEHRGHV